MSNWSFVEEDFEAKKVEIAEYLKFLELINTIVEPSSQKEVSSDYNQGNVENGITKPINELKGTLIANKQLRATLMASTILLIYNLVESTVRAALQQICDVIANSEVEFGNLSKKMQKLFLEEIQGTATKSTLDKRDLIKALSPNALQLIKISVEIKKTLKNDQIKTITDCYGIELNPSRNLESEKASLTYIAGKRNSLAHGNERFATVGRDITLEDLRRYYEDVSRYLHRFLQDIHKFLQTKSYLDPNFIRS